MLLNPVPGTSWQEDGGYDSDSGLDILVSVGTACVAAADGVVEYAEIGHTPWWEDTNPATPNFDPPHSVRIRLDDPISQNGITYHFIWYTHLYQVDNAILNRSGVRISQGDPVGLTGVGNRVPHLHFGIIHDRAQTVWMHHRDIGRLVWGRRTHVQAVNVEVSGVRIQGSILHEERSYVPLGQVQQQLNWTHVQNPSATSVVLNANGREIFFSLVKVQGTDYLSCREIASSLGVIPSWDSGTRTVRI